MERKSLVKDRTKNADGSISYVYQDRRYVGNLESFGYILHRWGTGFDINHYKTRFIYDVLLIDFNYLAFLNLVGGIWDVVNDTFIGVIVDRTRTRWGKFRPYLLLMSVPLTLMSCFYWLMPYIFPNTSAVYMPKFIVYFLFNIITETATTFTGMAETGLLSTITPHPNERVRLNIKANLLAIGSNVPELIMGLMIDLVNNKVVNIKLQNLFTGFGVSTCVIAAFASLFFFLVSKERVQQSVEIPSIKGGIKSIIMNKPLLCIVLSEFLEGFSIGTSMTDYYIDVLKMASMKNIVGIPGGIFSYSSYGLVAWARKRFSTKFLWIFDDLWRDMTWLFACGAGVVNKNYLKIGAMIPIMMIQESVEMCTYAFRKVVPRELENETMDYCEWKFGYRTEAMTGVAKSLITKLQRVVNNTIRQLIMGKIGYRQGLKIGTQSEKTKFWLFVMSTGIPVITGALGVLPKFFYPLTSEKREQMYNELIENRAVIAREVQENDMKRINLSDEAGGI